MVSCFMNVALAKLELAMAQGGGIYVLIGCDCAASRVLERAAIFANCESPKSGSQSHVRMEPNNLPATPDWIGLRGVPAQAELGQCRGLPRKK